MEGMNTRVVLAWLPRIHTMGNLVPVRYFAQGSAGVSGMSHSMAGFVPRRNFIQMQLYSPRSA